MRVAHVERGAAHGDRITVIMENRLEDDVAGWAARRAGPGAAA
jgi:hypothetical protein